MAAPLPLLRKYELFRIGYRLRSQDFTGKVVLQEPDGNTVITFEGGVPVTAISSQVGFSFPAFLLRRRKLSRVQLRELLEEASRKGIKLEELLLMKGLFLHKEVARLKRDLSAFVFTASFHKEKVPYRIIPGERSERSVRARKVLDLHEALFRAVASDKDSESLSRIFRDRWDEPLAKTADFYRYLVQFRSVFSGEDITNLLINSDITPRSVLARAVNKESALRQLYSMWFSGMVVLSQEGKESRQNEFLDTSHLGTADEGKTVVIMPQTEDTLVVTSVIGKEDTPFQAKGSVVPQERSGSERPLFDREAFLGTGFAQDLKTELKAEKGPERLAPGDKRDGGNKRSPGEPEKKGVSAPVYARSGVTQRLPESAGMEHTEDPTSPGEYPLEEFDESTDEAAVTLPIGISPVGGVPDSPLQGWHKEETGGFKVPPDSKEQTTVDKLVDRAVADAESAVAAGMKLPPSTTSLEAAQKERHPSELDGSSPPSTPVLAPLGSPNEPESNLLALKQPEPLPERPLKPEAGSDEAIERVLEDVYRGMLSRNLYQILNVTPFSPLSVIRENASRLLAKYAPEQYRNYMLSQRARTILEYIAREINRALQVLTNQRERLAYDSLVRTSYGQDSQVALSFLFEAESSYQKGLVEAKKGNWPEALMLFTAAAEANPRDAEYLAYKGWATWQALKAGKNTTSLALGKARNVLEQALTVDPRQPRAMLFLGRIEREVGNLEAAITWYERLHKLEPFNEEVLQALDYLRPSSGAERVSPRVGFWSRLKGLFRKR